MILFLLIFFGLQTLVLFCCFAAGSDPGEQKLSDLEQVKFLENWARQKR